MPAKPTIHVPQGQFMRVSAIHAVGGDGTRGKRANYLCNGVEGPRRTASIIHARQCNLSASSVTHSRDTFSSRRRQGSFDPSDLSRRRQCMTAGQFMSAGQFTTALPLIHDRRSIHVCRTIHLKRSLVIPSGFLRMTRSVLFTDAPSATAARARRIRPGSALRLPRGPHRATSTSPCPMRRRRRKAAASYSTVRKRPRRRERKASAFLSVSPLRSAKAGRFRSPCSTMPGPRSWPMSRPTALCPVRMSEVR